MSQSSLRIAVTPILTDPFFQEARSRIIWATSTCDANLELGFKSCLTGNASATKIPFTKNPEWISSELKDFYGAKNRIELLPVFEPSKYWVKDKSEFVYGYLAPKHILPYADVFHTRDPILADLVIKHRKHVIFEDHAETVQDEYRSTIADKLDSVAFSCMYYSIHQKLI